MVLCLAEEMKMELIADNHYGIYIPQLIAESGLLSAGGTANVVAGVIASRCGISFEDARRILDQAGREWAGDDWYTILLNIQPFRWDGWDPWDSWDVWNEMPGRWDVRTVAKAACRLC